MGLEAATYVSSLNSSNPTAGDNLSQGDDHIRLIKAVLLATFPGLSGAVTPTHTELNYVDGVTSSIQTQLDALSVLIAARLQLAGGTMTGDLTLAGDPDSALKAATKQYVDGVAALLLSKSGGMMTGDLILAGDPDSALKAATKQYVDDFVAQAFQVVDKKPSGTDGGTFTSGADRTRDLNTVVKNTIPGASLAANQLIIPAGAYKVEARSQAFSVGSNQLVLYNVTDASIAARGMSAFAYVNLYGASACEAVLCDFIDIAEEKTFELRHRCEGTKGINGFGVSCGFGDERYSSITFTKM